jgi:hypothetical protein
MTEKMCQCPIVFNRRVRATSVAAGQGLSDAATNIKRVPSVTGMATTLEPEECITKSKINTRIPCLLRFFFIFVLYQTKIR